MRRDIQKKPLGHGLMSQQGRKESAVLNMMIGEIQMETLTWRKELEKKSLSN
jgi:hypothetical protein